MSRLLFRCSGALIAAGLTGLAGAVAFWGCAQQPIAVPTRSLERSGRASFVCLGQPRSDDPKYPGRGQARPITDCTTQQVLEVTNYISDLDVGSDPDTATAAQCTDGGPKNDLESSSKLPHLYGLVTQTTRGEVAVVDVTAKNDPVLDQDPSVPGANFLPIGAQPVDIVSSPGGTASFVGVAEVGREGIFALPSSMIRPRSADPCSGAPELPAPQISSWPACRLPSAPGQMVLVNDPEVGGQVRASCDGAYDTSPPAGEHGDLSLEGQGRQKLVVAMPDKGGVVVIDAQALLDRPAGSFDACPVDRWLPLSADVPMLAPPPPFMGQACASPESVGPKYVPPYTARPTSISYANGRLYASDLSAPLVHVIDMPTPCEPVEQPPLLPTSVTAPKRVITTTKVAVASTLTPDLKRYLYAVDTEDGSAMVFDVSDNQAARFPISRPHPEWNPLEPPDRIRFAAPIADVVLVERDVPMTLPGTGVAPHGTRCDPNPYLTPCAPTSQSCDVSTLYRTSADYSSGAGPTKLRGAFAFFALSSGRVAAIDLDDFDARCRAPALNSALYGCAPQCAHDTDCGPASSSGCLDGVCVPLCQKDTKGEWPSDCTNILTVDAVDTFARLVAVASSKELSCNIVIPNTPRMSVYDTYSSSATINRVPGLQTFPLLYDKTGALVTMVNATTPAMVATVPRGSSNIDFSLAIAAGPVPINPANGSISQDGIKNALVMNLEDPHAQLVDENWTVTFEGPLPGFGQQAGILKVQTVTGMLVDADSRFCDAGVLSEKAVREDLIARADDPSKARGLADYVQIATPLALQEDPYWKTATACDFDTCLKVFGDADAPQAGRDFRITEAYQDRVELTERDRLSCTTMADCPKGLDSCVSGVCAKACNTVSDCTDGLACVSGVCARVPVQCCFPTLVSFSVRAGGQWVVEGDASGLLHHVIADPTTGVCRNSCDPRRVRENGRVPQAPAQRCIADIDCGGPTSGIVCSDKDKVCITGCRTAGGNGCPSKGACTVNTGKTIGACPTPSPFPITDGDPGAFINPMFRFAVLDGVQDGERVSPERDTVFRFTTAGSFLPLVMDLAAGVANVTNATTNTTTTAPPLILPVGMTVVPATTELAVTDGSINGLILVNLSSVGVSKVFF